ncbi:hypothetical protein HN51_038941 [Arachis hypogaea]|nr:VQ motif-containing protein 17-like [Arachis hypogaea]QHN84385.1 VQ motif-containing protein [Arachis hypogaea]
MESKLRKVDSNENEICIGDYSSSLAMHKDSKTISKTRTKNPKIRIIHMFPPQIIKTEAQNFRELVQRITGKPPTTTHENCCNIQKKPPTISSSEEEVVCGGGYLGGFSDLEQSFISELPMLPFDI